MWAFYPKILPVIGTESENACRMCCEHFLGNTIVVTSSYRLLIIFSSTVLEFNFKMLKSTTTINAVVVFEFFFESQLVLFCFDLDCFVLNCFVQILNAHLFETLTFK